MSSDPFSALKITRRFHASPERIFDAWLDPDTVRKWLFTSPTSEEHRIDLDPRVGGKWTIVDRRDGTDYTAMGEYIEIERPSRLLFTFGMPQFSSEFCRVTIQVSQETMGCTLLLTQEPVPSESVRALEEGWSAMFVQLELIVDQSMS